MEQQGVGRAPTPVAVTLELPSATDVTLQASRMLQRLGSPKVLQSCSPPLSSWRRRSLWRWSTQTTTPADASPGTAWTSTHADAICAGGRRRVRSRRSCSAKLLRAAGARFRLHRRSRARMHSRPGTPQMSDRSLRRWRRLAPLSPAWQEAAVDRPRAPVGAEDGSEPRARPPIHRPRRGRRVDSYTALGVHRDRPQPTRRRPPGPSSTGVRYRRPRSRSLPPAGRPWPPLEAA